MTGLPISAGVVHALPEDLRDRLVADPAARAAWEDITPLARNEWICWIESVKRAETRLKHLDRACADLTAGKRRPCCWPGCPHREKGAGARGAGQGGRSVVRVPGWSGICG